MNEIAKQRIVDKLLEALKKEELTQSEVARMFHVDPSYISTMKHPEQWKLVSIKTWDVFLEWINSGLTLKQYSEKFKGKLQREAADGLGETVFPPEDNKEEHKKEEMLFLKSELVKSDIVSITPKNNVSEYSNDELCERFARIWNEMTTRELLIPFLKHSGYSGKLTKEIIF